MKLSFLANRVNLLLILLSLLVLSACQNQSNEETEITYADLPTVDYKYDEEARVEFQNLRGRGRTNRYENLTIRPNSILSKPSNMPSSLFYDSGIEIEYPEDGVKGIYVTVDNILEIDTFNYLFDHVDQTALNAMVIDFKDDTGAITADVETDNQDIQDNVWGVIDMPQLLKRLESAQIYPIARIVTFKDYLLALNRPDLSFHLKEDGEMWQDGNGALFTNPFLQEVWDYNVEIAIEAAKMGFKEIQFDYVRFPEGFQEFDSDLEYERGGYQEYATDNPEEFGSERVAAINDFLEYARQALAPYGVKVSADVFGYTAIAGDAPDVRGIGQNFALMAEHVDVVSSMIYPSHWNAGFFGFDYPDLYPFEIVDTYMFSEAIALSDVHHPVTSRPWLQDFTDSSLPPGTYQEYSAPQVQAQINALMKHGVHEFLLWNVNGDYSPGVDYAPELTGSYQPGDEEEVVETYDEYGDEVYPLEQVFE